MTIDKPSLYVLAGLQLKEDITVEDVLDSMKIGQFNTQPLMEPGIERLKNVLLDPGNLKISFSDSGASIFESQTYYIGGVFDGTLMSLTPWKLQERADFDILKAELQAGRLLVKKAAEGYVIVATKDMVDKMTLETDLVGYWNDLVAEFFNHVIQQMTPWVIKPTIKPFSTFIDVDDCHEIEGVITNNESFLIETLEDLLDAPLNQLTAFVRQDVMDLMIAASNRRGVQVTRYGNAVALKYAIELENKRLLESQQETHY